MISYFKGSRNHWQTGLKTYARLVYADLWPGIDLVYSGTVNRLKYEFVVKPGADPGQIKLAYRGATAVRLNPDGQIEVATPAGGFHDDKPYAYQEANGRRVEVNTTYALTPAMGADVYGFRVGDYDRGKPLTLDPAVLVYSGFIGGAGDDTGNSIAVDDEGNVYVAGTASSSATSFPSAVGMRQNIDGGGSDVFVARLNAAGTAMFYASYLSGDAFKVMNYGSRSGAFATINSVTQSQSSCSGTSTVNCNPGALASGANATVTIVVTPTAGGTITNTASVTSGVFDPNTANNSASASTVVNAAADLAITKNASPNPVTTGANITYTLTVTNNSPGAASSATVTDNLPASTTFVSCAATGGVCGGAGNNRTVTFASLASGASATITLVAQAGCAVADDAVISNTATVSAATPDPNPDNNSATAMTTASNPPPTITCPANITKATDPGQCSTIVSFATPVANDNCSGATVVCSSRSTIRARPSQPARPNFNSSLPISTSTA